MPEWRQDRHRTICRDAADATAFVPSCQDAAFQVADVVVARPEKAASASPAIGSPFGIF
jgi:hypothetical protein